MIDIRDSGGSALPPDPGFNDVEVLEALIEGAPDGLALLSRSGHVLRINEAAVRLLGARREDIIGRSVADHVVGLNVHASWVSRALSSEASVSRAFDVGEGRKLMATLRGTTPAGVAAVPKYLILSLRDVSATNQLLGRVQAAAPTSAPQWSQMRRGDPEIGHIVTDSGTMRRVIEMARQFALVDSPVLIVGETGTGKSLIARIIHLASTRASAPLREINAGAIPAGLIETELFGYVRGAFTGADAKGKTGLIELANDGTLLLDEIGDMPLGLQVKLLQFLEAGEVWPIGGAKPKRVDVRVIAATNADLTEMVARGTFRRDLFYRLNVLVLRVPPLREHREDIPPLIAMMTESLGRRLRRPFEISKDAVQLLANYPYPGNVRELWNIVERLAVSCPGGVAEVADLPSEVTQAAFPIGASESATNLRQMLRDVETGIVREALRRYRTQTAAAKHLGVGQATIARKARLGDPDKSQPFASS